jgi:di/tripeptidase
LRRIIENFESFRKTLENPEVMLSFKNMITKVVIDVFSWKRIKKTTWNHWFNNSKKRSTILVRRSSMLMKLRKGIRKKWIRSSLRSGDQILQFLEEIPEGTKRSEGCLKTMKMRNMTWMLNKIKEQSPALKD